MVSNVAAAEGLACQSETSSLHQGLEVTDSDYASELSDDKGNSIFLQHTLETRADLNADEISFYEYMDDSQSIASSMDVKSNIRCDPRYRLSPREDNLYHCPFETSENCKHKPDKLKCIYQ